MSSVTNSKPASNALPSIPNVTISSSWWHFREIIMITGTLIAITGVVTTVISGSNYLAAAFGALGVIDVAGLVIMINYVKSEEGEEDLRKIEGSYETEIDVMQREVEKLKVENAKLAADNASLNAVFKSLETINKDMKKDNKNLKLDVTHLDKEGQDLTKIAKDFQVAASSTEHSMGTMQEELKEDAEFIQSLRSSTQELQEQNAKLKEAITILEIENADLASRLQALLEQGVKKNEEIQQGLNALKVALKQKVATLQELEKAQDNEKQTVKALTDISKPLQDSILDLKTLLKSNASAKAELEAFIASSPKPAVRSLP